MTPLLAALAVTIQFAAFAPPHVDVLAGDTTTWRNVSGRIHTVTAADGAWTSARLSTGASFSHRFDAPGDYAYYCQIHPFMRGEVDVHRLLLTAPSEPAVPGRPFVLAGRAALPAGTVVTLDEDTGTGTRPAATAIVGSDGGFQASVVANASATFTAVAGTDASPPVQVLVLDRTVTASARRSGRRWKLTARVSPPSPGARVVLQLHLRERFGWWPVRSARLGRDSAASFRLRLHRRVKARVVLTLSDRATVLARSAVLRVGARR
jgi:copper binding plastocyanin/azurin family protein